MAINVVSLFSGGGGLDLGFKNAGYNIIWAIDNNKNAVMTYKANIGEHIICADLHHIDVADIPCADVVIGGPPCQSFSLAGNRNVEDARGQLIWKYIHIIEQVKPKAFVFENVVGLLSAKNSEGKKIINLLKQTFDKIGYTTSTEIVNAADYGIPQRRKRVIIVGLKNGKSFSFPTRTHCEDGNGLKRYVSVEEALGDLPLAVEDEKAMLDYRVTPQNEYQERMRANGKISEHFIPRMSELDEYIISHVKPGGNYRDIPSDVNSARIKRLQCNGGHTTCYGRLRKEEPSYTINTYFNRPNVGCNIHYTENRLITVREALRLQSFPDSYIMVSSSKQGKNLIVGNAVPPMLAEVIAKELKKYILERRHSMWISYSDSEVKKFHPVCERALNHALHLLGKENEYRILHHQYTGGLEMDYVIQNVVTGKYLCVVEVKRTLSDINSTRYQFQAMSYVQMNANESEKPFYILTNLEYAFAFRYDAFKPRAFQQMLKPGLVKIGSFTEDDERNFVNKLAGYFKERISEYCSDSYDYLVTLEEFASHMEQIKDNLKQWKSHLAIMLYEYIRGAFIFLNRSDLPDIRIFHNDISRICSEAMRINFKGIFNYNENSFERNAVIDNFSLVKLYDFGNQNISGDSVSGILHHIVSAGHEHEGEVATDLELASVVAELAKYISGDLGEGDLLCDPAAGSGNLVSSATNVFGLKPTQILVNDSNEQLLELLSLRLGMNFAKTISCSNSPAIYNKSVVELDRSFFEYVKVIVMNPPFVAGINCGNRKQAFYDKIHLLTGQEAETDIGQMPLEAVFLELITHLVKPGTTIACVFPKTHLTARGIEAQKIRKLLLDNLGLRVVFTYPGSEIFDNVIKDTCVLVGKAMRFSNSIDVVSSYEKIPDLDTHRFAQLLVREFSTDFKILMSGIVARKVSADILRSDIVDGWRFLNSEMVDAIAFVKNHFECAANMIPLSKFDFSIEPKRGGAANSGGSDIMFFDSREDLYSQFEGIDVVLKAGMRNARLDTLDIGDGDSKFLDAAANKETLIDDIIKAYIQLPVRSSRQPRQQKTPHAWKRILENESHNGFPANSVLIPRAIRAVGRVYLSREKVFVSTNFLVCTLSSYEEALILSSWMTTIFYQLICEASSKDQEGMRKMEVNDINTTFVPCLNGVSKNTVNKISIIKNDIVFVNLNNPEIREIDRIWAEELFGNDANEKLEQAQRLLGFLAKRRNV